MFDVSEHALSNMVLCSLNAPFFVAHALSTAIAITSIQLFIDFLECLIMEDGLVFAWVWKNDGVGFTIWVLLLLT